MELVKTPSPQQQAVIDFPRAGRGSAFVEAVAGAGKTTTLINTLGQTSGSVAFAAYNKKIADEIKAKTAKMNLGNRVRVGTFHSFGFSAWRYAYPKVRVAGDIKQDAVLEQLAVPRHLQGFVPKLIGLAKQRAIGLYGSVEDRKLWWDIVDHFDLAQEVEEVGANTLEQGVEMAIRGLQIHRDMAPDVIDFDDMIYMPVVSGIRMWQNDWIFVDEAQDTNPARRALARKMLKPSGRAIFVGDRHQAIYGFTGADNDAIDQINRDFRCATLPLTITYRCPKSVVAKAKEVVDHIEAAPTAPQGTVGYTDDRSMLTDTKWHATEDAILCRNTKPLVQLAYTLIKRNVACHVEGRDIGMGLLKLVNKFNALDLVELEAKLTGYRERETEKLRAKGRETQAEALNDRVDTIFVIMDGCCTMQDLTGKIMDLFVDSDNERKPTLTLSTVHKAKGREWQRVFVLGHRQYMPSKWARQEWQQQQEDNLIYVAYTRAQATLVLVDVVE